MPDLKKIATLWTTAMSSPGATNLKALSAVLADDVTTSTKSGRADVLAWFGTWPGKAMFRTGSWEKPSVDGDVVTVICMFDPKAAFYRATVRLTVGAAGLVTRAAIDVSAAPEPLGSVITRVWGPRAGLDRLPRHLEETYSTKVTKVTRLDNGVLKVDRAKGAAWIVRVFPADRPLAEVKGDAAILSFLEENDYPAERCVADVSTFEGQGVLVTGFIQGKQADGSERTAARMASLLGRLHAMRGGPKAARRDAGGLHLYSADCSVRNEIDNARACLEAGAFRGKTDKAYATMMDALSSADDFGSLPKALSHPDFHVKNTIASGSALVPIDWAGVGRAPRVLALGMLLFYGGITPKGWSTKRVDAMIGAYREHVEPTRPELDRLAQAMQHRMLIHEAFSWSAGMATQRKPASRKDWPQNNATCEGIAAGARTAFGT